MTKWQWYKLCFKSQWWNPWFYLLLLAILGGGHGWINKMIIACITIVFCPALIMLIHFQEGKLVFKDKK